MVGDGTKNAVSSLDARLFHCPAASLAETARSADIPQNDVGLDFRLSD
jgi:hypothetical protein